MILNNLLKGVEFRSEDDLGLEIAKVQFDSRKVAEGDVFVAVNGLHVDGHDYINKAIAAGCVAIVGEKEKGDIAENFDKVIYVQVNDSSKALGVMASNYYGNPSSKLDIVAVTGTNGKTSTVTLLFQLFEKLGHSVGLLSTVENRINDEIIPSTHTTADALAINEMLAKMVSEGVSHCFMEASSHAIVQNRMFGLRLKGAVFTNISHDHLDYHGTFKEYISAKKLLFDRLGKESFALVNVDDKRGLVMLQNSKAKAYTYSLKNPSDFKARLIADTFEGLQLELDRKEVWLRMTGLFNAYNILAVYAVASLLDEDSDEALMILSQLKGAEGRFERIENQKSLTAIVDYAHTPDALGNVLDTIKKVGPEGKIITVVGCGGDRDRTKRPEMAKIACSLSDKVILTSDNPRSEDPELILNEMVKGVRDEDLHKYIKLTDRREAIKLSVMLAEKGDVILIAGKGHETYQEINGIKSHFDDREELRSFLDA
ncbi:UDP-N-acetylmuramoyl-L-alanyl-D-glutamate--2,6-diaminopimelate ligase [Aureibacter tunicatorum]|uniref:UDP-N-acetylmuramoyl-L-alanyl-D-glutamate--2,6-diaminopimelate ligase n=1 Tax=Aureibacter tunicatorum TaxID=866807 RepID=A0AAE3XNM2_9BACT|nr:UDP-N-acetylmuramoyl-L-alanyl-D-glutamate--2,6-diaminopimelate ligase [Aureibacter tunicatorum]MDR6241236.1 UDP-N-acetylmuramoyl-L-alanyl-D-glutamate--2,6-diaminopimelate ligase [Aureibacter tunicatorum]BDD03496.1 UDP-N-acetylmuramoyl-L-alanyl-D-glutamate--2,6-diaminopimelate ligase [Aureibacter tunicatorum]